MERGFQDFFIRLKDLFFFLKMFRVNQGNCSVGDAGESRVFLTGAVPHKKKHVLPVTGVNRGIVPYPWADTIRNRKPVLLKYFYPVRRVLFIDMVYAALSGYRSRKKDQIAHTAKGADKSPGMICPDMFGHFK